jgi:hypothetical protein
MKDWIYKDKEIKCLEDFGEETPYGFIYVITHKSGKKYIGKKFLFHNTNKKLGKKELLALQLERKEKGLRGAAPKKKLVTKESDWKSYFSSNNEIKQMIKNGEAGDFRREILYLVYDKKLLTYFENKYLYSHSVLENPTMYWNDNIQGRFFTKDFY